MVKLAQSSYTRFLGRFLPVVAVGLFAWISILTFTLPSSYRAQHWVATWVGFDVAMLVSIATTAWAIRKKRQLAIPAAMVSATLLVIDAWFDLMTSRPGIDFKLAVAAAAFGEIPMALLLFNFIKRSIHRSLTNAHQRAGVDYVSTSLARTPLVIFDDL